MWTTVLAYLIVFMGFITFASGALGAMNLLFEEVGRSDGQRNPGPFKCAVRCPLL